VILLSRPFRADSRLSPTQGVALGWYVMPLRGCKPSAPNQMAGVMIKAFIFVKIFTLTYLWWRSLTVSRSLKISGVHFSGIQLEGDNQ
jgi:hypothetical protein